MEIYRVENLSFKYPEEEEKVLNNISLDVKSGEFLTICGASGSGKSTLLRQLKPILSPHGLKEGKIYFKNKNIENLSQKKEASEIGFVLQNPENQIVTDKVWHELAFGLESLGYENDIIRLRVGEMASFFGIHNWFHKSTNELSGGQMQILNLAAVMVMQPSVLILDEPTSQLDPIAASDFLNTLKRINLELGTTIIISEHRLEEVIPMSDRIMVLDSGKILTSGNINKVGRELNESDHPMFYSMTSAMQIYGGLGNTDKFPITVRDGRQWIEGYLKDKNMDFKYEEEYIKNDRSNIIEIKDVWFRYDKKGKDVIKNLNLYIEEGEFFAIVGGNGTGKTTALSLISRLNQHYRGRINIKGKSIDKYKDNELYGKTLGILPQSPQNLFVKNNVKDDLLEIFKYNKESDDKKKNKIENIIKIMELEGLEDRHPYDLSGGEQQRLGLAKILLQDPEIILLDEPTKGMDEFFKVKFSKILDKLQSKGKTIVMVSHDIEFCASYADTCSLFFDGNIISMAPTRKFFAGNSFYTTSANRIIRNLDPYAIIVEDVIKICQ